MKRIEIGPITAQQFDKVISTHEIPNGVFDESGTNIATMAIVIRRKPIVYNTNTLT